LRQRLKTVLLVPDTHAPYHDRDAWELMLDCGRELKPDTLVCIGDLADFYAVSGFSKSPERAALLKEEVENVRARVRELESLDARERIFCEGNHEFRLTRYLQDKAPALFGTVSVQTILGLEDWEFIPYRKHTRRGKVHFSHDTGHTGRHSVFRALDAYQHSVVTGHTHRLGYIVEGNAVGECKLSAQFGWLGDVEKVDYMHEVKARKDWALGFGVGYLDTQTGHCHFQPVPIVKYRCVVGGKLFKAPARRKRR
jgi:predicted phosphodiesterase